jgi:hypothetical protein
MKGWRKSIKGSDELAIEQANLGIRENTERVRNGRRKRDGK